MKHLATYKLFESLLQPKEVREYISDLFSDIRESGVRIFVHPRYNPEGYSISIGEYSDQVMFSYADVIDEVKHMISYFINEGNMRLGDVDVVTNASQEHPSTMIRLSGGSVPGWQRLKYLEERGNRKWIYSITLNFTSRGSTILESESVVKSESDFISIADSLQDIFDDYNIPYVNSEDISSDEERWNKRWEFAYNREGSMRQINILNLIPSEHKDIEKKIIDLIPIIRGRTGHSIIFDTYVNDGKDFISYDIIIK